MNTCGIPVWHPNGPRAEGLSESPGCQLGALYVPTHRILGTIFSLRSHVVTNIKIRNNTIIDVVDDRVIF